MPLLTIIRGLPGSGKSTLAKTLASASNAFHVEADMYFMTNDVYRFDASKIKDAHEYCKQCAKSTMDKGYNLIVSNTFKQLWEYQPYLNMAKEYKYQVQVIECHGDWQNVHNVPQEAIERMRRYWQPHNFNFNVYE